MNESGYILPPEWAPQSAIQLTWPHPATDWADCLGDICATYMQMAAAIADHERLIVVAPEPETVIEELRRNLPAASMANIVFHKCPTDDTWARDHALITLTNAQGSARLLDFCFNGWGNKFASDNDNRINRSLYDSGLLKGQYVDHLDFVLEGGSIESDGCGTVFTTSQCLLADNRNQPLGQSDIEQRLTDILGAQRIVWLDHGNLIGDDTDGHIDTIVRTAPDHTLLYVGCDDENDEQYADLKALEQQLSTIRTMDDQPYRLLRLPMPNAVTDEDGMRLPATYANFLVTNEAVLVPVYEQPENDAAALRTIGQAFSTHRLVPINSLTIIRQHGSIHCCTMQYPEGVVVLR